MKKNVINNMMSKKSLDEHLKFVKNKPDGLNMNTRSVRDRARTIDQSPK